MTAPTADVRVCAWCGRTIPDGSERSLYRLPKVYAVGDWFCDWTCEGHYSAAAPDAPGRKRTRGTSVTRSA